MEESALTYVAVSYLAERFTQAQGMVEDTEEYYNKISSDIPQQDILMWDSAIRAAEERRCTDPSAMDILAAQQLKRPENAETENHVGLVVTPGQEWCQRTLAVEERQYVTATFFDSF